MSRALYLIGDALTVLRAMPDESIDMGITSPPFLCLRDYLPADDPAKVHEIGRETTPGEFIDALLDVTEEVHRVLVPTGSWCVELGDTYAGSGGAGGDYSEGGLRDGQQAFSGSARKRAKAGITDGGRPSRSNRPRSQAIAEGTTSRPPRDAKHHRGGDDEHLRRYAAGKRNDHARDGWPYDKSLCLIPELYRLALVYGFNPLTGRETIQWRARNVVRWCRPNPPVGALGDKVRPATSDLVVACKVDEGGRRRYFDLDAVRTPAKDTGPRSTNGPKIDARDGEPRYNQRIASNLAGAPPLDWWEIPTKPYKGQHYATFPPALIERPIKMMAPTKVCTTCCEPSRRLTEPLVPPLGTGFTRTRSDPRGRPSSATPEQKAGGNATLGWSCCGHGDGCQPTTWKVATLEVEQGKAPDGKWVDLDEWDDPTTEPTEVRTKRKRKKVVDDVGTCAGNHWRPGRVLDPFGGSGTTGMVATGHGRDAVLVDLDRRNVDLARDRVGPLFLIETDVDELPELLTPPATEGAA